MANKLSLAMSDLDEQEHPLESLLVLGTSQWLLAGILSKWQRIKEKDSHLIVNVLGITQNNVSIALSCIQAHCRCNPLKQEGKVMRAPYPLSFKR